MKAKENPFKPTAGGEPPLLIGRGKIIKSWVEPTEENSRGDNDPAAIRGDNN